MVERLFERKIPKGAKVEWILARKIQGKSARNEWMVVARW